MFALLIEIVTKIKTLLFFSFVKMKIQCEFFVIIA